LGIVRQAADEGCEKRIFRSIKGEVPHRAAGQSGEAYKVLSQDRRRAVSYVCPSICTFVEE
jgi:hypothetical protein